MYFFFLLKKKIKLYFRLINRTQIKSIPNDLHKKLNFFQLYLHKKLNFFFF